MIIIPLAHTHVSCWKRRKKWALWKLLRVGCLASSARVRAHAKRHVSLSWFFATFVPLQHFSPSLISFFAFTIAVKKMRHGEMMLIFSPLFQVVGDYKIVELRIALSLVGASDYYFFFFPTLPRLGFANVSNDVKETRPCLEPGILQDNQQSIASCFFVFLPCTFFHIIVNVRLHVHIWLLEKERKEESLERSLIVGAKKKTPLCHFPKISLVPLLFFSISLENEITTRRGWKTKFYTLNWYLR